MDRVALVTGGGGDIGRAVALHLAKNGHRVAIVDVEAHALSGTVTAIQEDGGEAFGSVVDLAAASSCLSAVEDVWQDVGPIGTVVNAAAVTHRGRIDQIPLEAWERVLSVNLSAVYWICRAAIGRMLESGRGGTIVNVASVAGVRGLPGSPAYAATKGGVVALSRALATDHASQGIRVHAVAPPAIDTRLYRRMFESETDPEAARRRYESDQPAGRVLRVDEIVALIGYLVERRGPIYSPEPLVW